MRELPTFTDQHGDLQPSQMPPTLRRRDFLRLMGASLSLMGLTGCAVRQPEEKILPYADQPDGMTPGRPLAFATAMPRPDDGFGVGALVTSREGRPIKVEGNPQHPSSLGRSDIFLQASLLTLYDPDRSQSVQKQGSPSTLDAFHLTLAPLLTEQERDGGARIRFLCPPITSPTVATQITALRQRFPAARWYVHRPSDPNGGALNGTVLAFGRRFQPVYRFDRVRRVLALDADFLRELPGSIRYAADFANGRRVRTGVSEMSRLYAVEPAPTLTGAMADHRWPTRASQVEGFARAVAASMGIAGVADNSGTAAMDSEMVAAMAADLQQAGPAALVIAGSGQPPAVHGLAHIMNASLGSMGVHYIDPVTALAEDAGDLAALVREMETGAVSVLFVLGCNPVYDSPADLAFADALARVPISVHHGLYFDETAAACTWHVPEAHYLETWGDVRGHDGTATICQPLIAPLFDGVSLAEFLNLLLPMPAAASGHDLVRTNWHRRWMDERRANDWPADFESFWRDCLKAGIVRGTASSEITLPRVRPVPPSPGDKAAEGLEIVFHRDPTVGDGFWANNAWLQELPDPMTGIVWDNAVLLSPRTADRYRLENGDIVELERAGRRLQGPIWRMPGHADDVVTVRLGRGRVRAGGVGSGVGFSAFPLRATDASHFATGLSLKKTGRRYRLVTVQEEQTQEGRDLVRTATLDRFRQKPDFVRDSEDNGASEDNPSLLPEFRYDGHAWGMVIDLNTCIGCHTCTIACQAENNIPVVGKEEAGRGRVMHWIRVDRYHDGPAETPSGFAFQPVPCMHCEKAPCELVCPVEATVHDEEGINNMVYNRCVGTRYCSNNCPYKVRRFNFLQYAIKTPLAQLMRNPEVTVRNRGVMEKCTYCIQRIKNAEIDAERDNAGRILDGTVRTACQQACPTDAIIFGDINDSQSNVRALKDQPHNYGLLTDLNTQPRTTYLARFTNPNPMVSREAHG